ncbi:MAG: ABC transporter ATP-binding protein [Phyllobacteriaceae bacterium]|nr:ABC transporter ATP-binding protein [Phyllobacteriaceae bacterium]
MLSVEHLVKRFGGVKAADDISLALAAGEMRAVIGPNGCGKTTLFNLITGYLKPDGGRVLFEGHDVHRLTLHGVAQLGIIRKFQVPSVFPDLSAADNLRIAGADDPLPALSRVGLRGQQNMKAGTLAHGQKQWLELAMTLAAQPKLLLLDEPAAGMTEAERRTTVELLKTLRSDNAIAIMLIEHDMKFVDALDCPVSVMDMGRIIASGEYHDIKSNAQVREAYLGAAGA